MSIRHRTWEKTAADGTTHRHSAWVVDYKDQHSKRRLKTFRTKKEAAAWAPKAAVEVQHGVHTADSASITIGEAGERWLAQCEADGLEQSTIAQYRQHLEGHIKPFLGSRRLSQFSAPAVREFASSLAEAGRSAVMVRKVLTSLGSLIGDAQECGLVNRNVVRELRRGRRRDRASAVEKRKRRNLRVGVDIPSREEIQAILATAKGRWRPILVTAIFTGLRASELRGLTWENVDFTKKVIHVRQRADRYNAIGPPKSEAGERAVPMSPLVLNTLQEWHLACPAGKNKLVFPTSRGTVQSLANIYNRGLAPTLVAAGVVSDRTATDAEGNLVLRPKYALHAFRHFYASWLINRRKDGGLELPPKRVQERLGHSTMQMTMDVYGHLFPAADDFDELAAAEQALLGSCNMDAT